MTHICVSDLTSISSDYGVSPGRRQAIIRTNAGILLIRPLETNFSEFLVEILIFSFKNLFESVVCEKAAIFSRPQWVDCVTRWYWILRCCCLYVSSSFNTIMWENHHQWTECNCNDGPVINKNTQLPTYRYLSNMTIAISLNIYA